MYSVRCVQGQFGQRIVQAVRGVKEEKTKANSSLDCLVSVVCHVASFQLRLMVVLVSRSITFSFLCFFVLKIDVSKIKPCVNRQVKQQ